MAIPQPTILGIGKVSPAVKKYNATKDQDEHKKLFTTYGQKLVDFAKANAKEDSAFEALTFVLNIPIPAGKDNPMDQAAAILTKEYAKSEKIAPLVGRTELGVYL